MVSDAIIHKLIDKYNVNTNVVPVNILKKAVEIEFEHKDIIDHDADKSFRIAMAHLREFPDYYVRLIKLESDADKYWTGKVKPSIYTTNARPQTTQIRTTRPETTAVNPRRAVRDNYGLRKGVKRRREVHVYPDYIPPKQIDREGERTKGKPKVEKHVGRPTTTDRGIQTESTGS